MKTIFITSLVLLIPVLGFSQLNQSIDFVGGIEYSYRKLKSSNQESALADFLENRNNTETGKSNWRIGFNYNRRLTSQFFIKTGIRLASVGYKGEKRTGLRWGSEHDGNGGWILNPDLPHEAQVITDHWFLEIPVVGRFEFNDNKFAPFLEFGLSPSIYLKTQSESITDLGTNTETYIYDFNKIHLVTSISFGINYSINDKLQAFGQPIFRYHLTKLTSTGISPNLLNYGIELGIRRAL